MAQRSNPALSKPVEQNSLHKTAYLIRNRAQRIPSWPGGTSPTKAVYICADQPATFTFCLQNGGGPYICSGAHKCMLFSIQAVAAGMISIFFCLLPYRGIEIEEIVSCSLILSDAAGLLAALMAAPVCTTGSARVTFMMPVRQRCPFLPRIEVWVFVIGSNRPHGRSIRLLAETRSHRLLGGGEFTAD